MADIRIKDLTTEASASLTGDFLPIDGGTGTRKLSAFNPTFGGNLTVSGLGTFAGILGTTAAAQRITNTGGAFQIYKDATPSKATRLSFNVAATDTASLGIYDGSSWTDTLQVNATQTLVTTTTASTSTSSGALVVGNGTSGGLGVGGAIYAGGAINGSGYVYPDANASFYLRGTGGGNGLIRSNIFSVDIDTSFLIRNAAGSSTYLTINSSNLTVANGVGLQLGNAYVAGAPTATGYIVIKDSTGTSYKIPAVAL